MANPWDPIPLPRDADLDDRITFESVGRIIDRWERIEFVLSRLYSLFVGKPNDGPAMREYGAGRILPERVNILRKAAEEWFVKNQNQKREGTFDRLTQEVLGFSDRRNEIAHGTVDRVSALTFFRERTSRADYLVQWAVVPAYQISKRYNFGGVPKYMYGTPEMKLLLERLIILYVALGDFLDELDPDAPL
jgi:hypothetical protein